MCKIRFSWNSILFIMLTSKQKIKSAKAEYDALSFPILSTIAQYAKEEDGVLTLTQLLEPSRASTSSTAGDGTAPEQSPAEGEPEEKVYYEVSPRLD